MIKEILAKEQQRWLDDKDNDYGGVGDVDGNNDGDADEDFDDNDDNYDQRYPCKGATEVAK